MKTSKSIVTIKSNLESTLERLKLRKSFIVEFQKISDLQLRAIASVPKKTNTPILSIPTD